MLSSFAEVLCHWGAVDEVISNNGTRYVTLLGLARKQVQYQTHPHFHLANGVVEWQNRTICEPLVKVCDGDLLK